LVHLLSWFGRRMNASYSFAQTKSFVFDDLARQKLRIVSEKAEPKRPKFRQSRLMIGVIGTRTRTLFCQWQLLR